CTLSARAVIVTPIRQLSQEGVTVMPLDQAILAEHAYLVSRGVRLVSVIGNGIPDEMESDRSQLGIASIDEPAIPFVIDLENGGTNYGYASHAWAVDLFRWASTRAPDIQAHR